MPVAEETVKCNCVVDKYFSKKLQPIVKARLTNFRESSKFHKLLEEIGELHDKKQKDYGREGDPFANVRSSEEWGIKPWVGAMNRASDKIKRLQKYAKCGTLANEGVKDSFMDLAVYSLIACILWQEEHEE